MLPLNNWTNVVQHLRKKMRFEAGRNPAVLQGALLTRTPAQASARAKEAQPVAPVTTKAEVPKPPFVEPAKPAKATSKGEAK